MALQCLLVTRDPSLLNQIREGFAHYGASLDLRQDSTSALELTSRRHWDGIVIDCDRSSNWMEVIRQVRDGGSNRQTPIFAVVNGAGVSAAVDLGATFVLSKPLQEARLRDLLDVAVPKMEREHRRYFRYTVDIPASCQTYDGEILTGTMKNISEGGLSIRLTAMRRLEGIVVVEFEIPKIEPQTFHAKAEVVWSDSSATGLRFLYVDNENRAALQGWLSALESRLQFHNATQPHS